MRIGVLSALLAMVPLASGAAGPPGDLVFVNGTVYTVDAARSWASAVVVTDEHIAYVGDDATARSLVGPGAHVIDLKQRMLLPGFQDSHVHPSGARNPATELDLHGLTHRAQVLARIAKYAQAHRDRPWIVGSGWDEVAFLPSGRPSREMLDSVVPDRPAYLSDNSGHEAWVNSRALEVAGIDSTTADPPNGHIERDVGGRPSGALQEDAAMKLVEARIPPPAAAERATDLAVALQTMLEFGFTALEDADVTPDVALAYQALDRRGSLRQRVNLCLEFDPAADDEAQISRLLAARDAFRGRRLRADCVKIFLDGAYGSHTLSLLEPYHDEPRFGRGRLFIEQARLNRIVTRLDAAGFQVHMHAIGDGAVRGGLDAVAAARGANGDRGTRHTLAHLSLIDATDIPRFRSLGVVANMTPLWSLGDAWETIFAPRLFGPERSKHIYKTRTLLEAGAVLVWGSDWPVTGVSPLEGLETAVTHRYPAGRDLAGSVDRAWNPDERVSLEQAIVAYTSAGAYLMHDETTRGSLTVGKRADFVVLHRNLFETAPLEIHAVPVDMTVIDGSIAYARAPE